MSSYDAMRPEQRPFSYLFNATTELRNPMHGFYHWEMKNLNAALEEFRAAYLVEPSNPNYKREYEKMLKRAKP